MIEHNNGARATCRIGLSVAAAQDAELLNALEGAGYTVAPADPDGLGADFSIYDARGPIGGDALNSYRAGAARGPALAILSFDADLSAYQRLSALGDVVFMGEDPAPAIMRARALMRLRDVGEETGDRLKTLAASGRIEAFPDGVESALRPRAVVFTRPEPSSLALLGALDAVDVSAAAAFSPAQALRYLEDGDGDCLIISPDDLAERASGVLAAIRAHPRLQGLPVIAAADSAERAGDLARLGVVDVAPIGLSDSTLPERVGMWSRRRRLTQRLVQFLRTPPNGECADRAAALYSSRLFHLHLERLIERAGESGRPLSLVAFRISGPGETAFAATARRAVAASRAEDFWGRIGDDVAAAAISGVSTRAAEAMAARIAGKLNGARTRGFAPRDVFEARYGVWALRPDLGPEAATAAALRQLGAHAANDGRESETAAPF